MANLLRCIDCGSFVAGDTCPHCASQYTRPTRLGALATAVGSSAFAMTLMACYGGGPGFGSIGDREVTGPTYVPDGVFADPECEEGNSLAAEDCDDDLQPPMDAGTDASLDAGSDAGSDAGDAATHAGDASSHADSGD